MQIDPTLTTVLEDGIQLVVVYGGPRGLPGPKGGAGDEGADGRSIRILGPWSGLVAYGPGDAVTSRGLDAPGVDSLWLVRESGDPTPGTAPHLEPTEWVEVGTGAGGFGPVWHVQQLLHPFTRIGQPACFSPVTGRYEVADTRDVRTLPIALVREIVDNGHVVLQAAGEVPGIDPALIVGGGAWQPGIIYYASTVPGMLQTTDPGTAGWISQPVLIPTRVTADGQVGTILGWGPEGRLPPGTVGAAPPTQPRVGDLWYRTDAWPGLYVRVLDDTGTLAMWVQANG